jgi:cytochrome P450
VPADGGAGSIGVSGYAPFAPAVLADPGSAYGYLRDRVPVHRCAAFDPPFYTLSRYRDVEAALRDTAAFSSEFGQGPRFTAPAGMLSDPPQHTLFRGLVQQAFTPKAIAALERRVRSLADELLDACAERETFDLHDDFAFPLPVTIIAEMLGVPAGDLHLFKHWSDASVAAMGSERPQEYAQTLGEMAAYLLDQIRQARQADRRDTLIVRLVAAEARGRVLDDGEILSVLTQLLVGGNETTTSLITNAVWRLLSEPSLWQQLLTEPDKVTAALEESLRFDPPVLGLFRNTTRAVSLHGVEIPAGSKVMLHYGAANRDPEVFDQPDRFWIDRPARRHMAFGLGVHFCLGAQLARLEGRVALAQLLLRFPRLSLVNDGRRVAPFFLWGRSQLPVRRGPAASIG